ncbi:MAG: NfeD family protein [Chloroflexota bacterium]
MFNEFLSSGTLNIVYASILLVSFLFTLLSLMGAEVGEALDFDFDFDGDFDFISVSPFAMSIFGAFFGLVGLITRLWLGMAPIPSLLWSTGIGLGGGVLAQIFFIYVLSKTVTQTYSLQDDAIGREAEVTVTIPKAGLGSIAYNNNTGRITLAARCEVGTKINTGTTVRIEQINGRTAIVRAVEK